MKKMWLLIFCLVINGCLAPESEKGVVTISGKISVFDESNVFLESELSGFLVEVLGSDKKAITDNSGYYSFTNMRSGTYALRISGKNYPTNITPLFITQDAKGSLSYDQLFTKKRSTTLIETADFKTDFGKFPQSNSNIYYTISIKPADIKSIYRGALIFIDTTNAPGTEQFVVVKDHVNALTGSISGTIKNADLLFDLNQVDTLYFAVYGITSISSADNSYLFREIYQDPESNKLVFPFINLAGKKVYKLPIHA